MTSPPLDRRSPSSSGRFTRTRSVIIRTAFMLSGASGFTGRIGLADIAYRRIRRPKMTLVKDLLDEGAARLKRSPAIDHWPAGRDRWEAESLLAFALGVDDALEVSRQTPVTGNAVRRFRHLIRRRAGGEPMAHILGWTEFRGLRIPVRPGAFVPRQSTEFLAEQAIRRLRGRMA